MLILANFLWQMISPIIHDHGKKSLGIDQDLPSLNGKSATLCPFGCRYIFFKQNWCSATLSSNGSHRSEMVEVETPKIQVAWTTSQTINVPTCTGRGKLMISWWCYCGLNAWWHNERHNSLILTCLISAVSRTGNNLQLLSVVDVWNALLSPFTAAWCELQ